MTEPRRPPRPGAAPWKLHAITALALVYLLAWHGAVTTTPASAPAAAPGAPAAPPRAAAPGPRAHALTRAPAGRPLRVRTRSS